MDVNRKELLDIKDVLKESPRGITVTEISKAVGMNRHSVAKYLEVLVASGHVDMRSFGPSKVYYLSQRVPLSAMLSFSSDAIVIVDKDLLIRNANDKFLETMGLTREKAINRNIENYMNHMPMTRNILEHIGESLEGKEQTQDTSYRRGADEVYFSVKYIPTIFDDGGKGVTIIMSDVSERRRIENAVRESEHKFRGMIGQSTDGITLCDEKGAVIEYNESMSRLTNTKRENVIGKNVWEIPFFIRAYAQLPDRPPVSLKKFVLNFLMSGKSSMKHRLNIFDIQMPYGSQLTVQANIFPIKSDKGYMLSAIVRDITEQKQAEEALRQSEQKFRGLMENINDIAWETDNKGRITYIGPQVRDILGYEPEYVVGRTILDFMPEDEKAKYLKYYTKAYALPRMYNLIVFLLYHKDCSIHPIEVNGSPVYDEKGEFAGYIGVVRDITMRKQMEETLELMKFSIDHSEEAIYWVKPDGGFYYVNDAACRMLGYTREELQSMSVTDVDKNIKASNIPRQFGKLNKIKYCKFETGHLTKDGTSIPVEVTQNYLEFNGQAYNFCFARPISRGK